MLGDVFVLVIITVVGLVFASVIDGEFLIRGDVLEPFAVENTAIFVFVQLGSYFIAGAGEWTCFNTSYSLPITPTVYP